MPNEIKLSELANGALAERFDIELSKVLANIADPNTDAKKTRSVTITVSLKADENRDVVLVDLSTKASLAPAKSVGTKFLIDQDSRGNVIGAELKSGTKDQMMVDNDGDVADHVGRKVSYLEQKQAQSGRN